MPHPTWETLSLQHAVVLRAAAARLAGEFDGTFGIETIERFLHSSYDQFADRATLTKFLPLIATLETDNLPPGSYVMVAAFPQRYLKGSQEFFQNGKGTMELQVEEPGPYTVVALSVTELGADGRPIYTVTQGPAIFDGNAGRLSFTGRLTRNHFSNGGGP